ncbi:MAG TPA: hypothetical protein VN890_06315 [Methylocella sp.]|nr:hypothetical protein [Methylocella sp.]
MAGLLDAGHVEPLGYLDPYPSGPGFSIVPVVAKAAAPVAFKINPDAVIEAFRGALRVSYECR